MSETTNSRYFTFIFGQHHSAIYAYAFKKTKDVFIAEEIAQNTFIKFWQHYLRKNCVAPENPEKLLFFISKALLVDYFRKKTVTVSVEQVSASATDIPDNSREQQLESLHFSTMVQSASETLPGRQKIIFEMSYFEELTHEQIAAKLNISRQTVKNQLTKAMKHVRKTTIQQFFSILISFL